MQFSAGIISISAHLITNFADTIHFTAHFIRNFAGKIHISAGMIRNSLVTINFDAHFIPKDARQDHKDAQRYYQLAQLLLYYAHICASMHHERA